MSTAGVTVAPSPVFRARLKLGLVSTQQTIQPFGTLGLRFKPDGQYGYHTGTFTAPLDFKTKSKAWGAVRTRHKLTFPPGSWEEVFPGSWCGLVASAHACAPPPAHPEKGREPP